MSIKAQGHRKFYQLPDTPPSSECGNEEFLAPGRLTKKFRSKSAHFRGSTRDLIQMIDHHIIGRDTTFQGPFGPRRCVYMDHTASGQPLRCIEGFISDHVLPYYGNTHTTTTLTSSQTTYYRHEAKDIVRNSVGASEHDVVIFCGSGATGAVHKLVQAVCGSGEREKPKPVVFVGPYEHHSNFLPWRDVGAKMVYIPETASGVFDMEFLEKSLKDAAADEDNKGRRLIGCFSVASNITGAVTDDVAVTILMHKYGGLAFWDYSAAAPHVQIVMNSVVTSTEEGLGRKDALYFSGHKFVGGPQTPGVLVAKNSIFEDTSPHGAGGGSVFFVTSDSHRYLKNTEYREEGGTPAIVESIRLGLAFRLKDTVGSQNIICQEAVYTKKAIEQWQSTPGIKILGPKHHPRLPIISFLIEHPETHYYLHHNYVVALLNDLFGIQARGGCACAGPYGQELLGINLDLAHEYEDLLLEDSRLNREHLRRYQEGSPYEIFRPGFTRISIPFYASLSEAEFVIEAVQLVAKQGWKLLPLYTFNPETGEFHHHANHMLHHRKWLSWASFDSEGIRCKERVRNNSEDCVNYKECMEQAKNILSNAHNMSRRRLLPDQSLLFDNKSSQLKWFLLPSEAQSLMNMDDMSQAVSTSIQSSQPFVVKMYHSKKEEDDDKLKPVAAPSPSRNLLSVPTQLLKSCWSLEESLKVSANKIVDQESLNENGTESELNVSSTESDNELIAEAHAEGTTVVGPSICFSMKTDVSPPVSQLCLGNEEPVLDPRSSFNLADESSPLKDCRKGYENYRGISISSDNANTDETNCLVSTTYPQTCLSTYPNLSGTVQNINSNGQSSLPVQNPQLENSLPRYTPSPVPCDNTNFFYGQQQCISSSPLPPAYAVSETVNTNNVYGQNYTTQNSSIGQNTSNVVSNYFNYASSPTNCVSPVPMMQNNYYNQSMANTQMNGNNTQVSIQSSGPIQQSVASQHQTNFICTQQQQSTNTVYPASPVNQVYNPNNNFNVVNNATTTTVACNNSNWSQGGHIMNQNQGSPQIFNTVSPVFSPAFDCTNNNNTSFNPSPTPQVTCSTEVSINNSWNQSPATVCSNLTLQQSTEVIQTALVGDAMRRVTNELANELKSEIRGVISQVEQGIDVEGIRGRANSYTAKDRTLDVIRKRSRTMSGQVLNGVFRKNLSFEEPSPPREPFTESRKSLTEFNLLDKNPATLVDKISKSSSKISQLMHSCSINLSSKSKENAENLDAGEGETKAESQEKAGDSTTTTVTTVEECKIPTAKWHCPPKYILKTTLKALKQFSMIENGDRVLVCLSGGKDSLTLLHTIKQVQYNLAKSGISFTFGAITVDPGSTSYNPRPLIPYLKALGVPYFYEEQGIMHTALDKGPEEVESICSFCSRMKRGRIYACARRNNYNVIAMGQHLDDLTESFFMSIFHNGILRTMKASYTVKEADLRVIRPLVNTREKALRDFAESRGLPVIPENCPACFDAPTERHRIKQLLAQQEILFPKIYVSLRGAMQPLMAVKKTGQETKSTVEKNLQDCSHVVDEDDF